MSAEENKRLFREFVEEIFNQGNLDRIDEVLSEDFIEHEELPGLPPGREAPRAFITMMRQAFPDARYTIDDLIAEGDKVVARGTITGTHRGEFLDIPATGNKIEVPLVDILRFRDGVGVEHWGVSDMLVLMQQLGVIPEQ